MQRKSMVSDVAHEQRSPLTNIRRWLEAAHDGLTPLNEALVTLLLDEALMLQHVIDDLRDLAAADAGNLPLHREMMAAGDLLKQVSAAHHGAADRAGVALHIDVEAGADLHADALWLRQVVGNLLSNAVRHTPPGGAVTLRASVSTARPYHRGDLPAALLHAAPGLLEEDETFSLRAVAQGRACHRRPVPALRRQGDAAGRPGDVRFHPARRPPRGDAAELADMAEQYVAFALAYPGMLRLMHGRPASNAAAARMARS